MTTSPWKTWTAAVRSIGAEPSTWVAIMILALPFSSASGPTTSLVTPSDLAAAVAVFVAGLALVRGRGVDVVRSVPAVVFAAFGLVSLLAAILSPEFTRGVVGSVRSAQLFFLVPIAVMIALRTRRDAVVILGSFIGLGLVQGAIGAVQAFTNTGASYGGSNIRAVGSFGAYNIGALASLSGLCVVACGALVFALKGRVRWVAAGVAMLMAVPLALALSRGAWVAAVVGLGVVASRGRPVRVVAALAVGGLLAVLVVPPVIASGSEIGERLEALVDAGNAPDQSVRDRLAMWQAARQMSYDRPLTGVGPRRFPENRDGYADLSLLGSSDIGVGSNYQQVELDSPHNFFLLVASEQGLVALLVFTTGLAVLAGRSLVRSARRRHDASTALALVGAGMLGYLLVEMLSGDLGGPNSIYVTLVLGVAGRAAIDRPFFDDTRMSAPPGRVQVEQ